MSDYKKIWLSSPHMCGEEIKYVNEAFAENWIAPLGPNVDGFEKDLSIYTGSKFVSALSSGTAAIHLALIMLGVKANDEVICSSFTFSASANPIVYQGAIPIFVDSEKETWNMDPELLEVAIKDRIAKGKKPKAIILAYLYGMPAQIDLIMQIANKFEIPVIEDAAEALGSTFNNKAMGTFGAMGVLSFNGNKIITTSGGGALISDNEEYITKSRFLATQARDNAPHYEHSNIGYNYRMSNICAGIGRGQMIVLNERVSKRRANYDFYKKELSLIESIRFLEEPQDMFSNRWLTCILIDDKNKKNINREKLRIALGEKNIESRPLWKPMHMQPVFGGVPVYENKTSENLFNIGLCLPSGSNLTDDELNFVVEEIKKCF